MVKLMNCSLITVLPVVTSQIRTSAIRFLPVVAIC